MSQDAYEARVVNQAVNRPARQVYEFARVMQNLPQWASGLAAGVRQEKGEWYTDSPMGSVRVAMAPKNDFGVLDHDVTLPDGTTVHNALRVTPAGEGSVVSFVVLRMPGTSAEAFEKDVAHVTGDLKALKAVMEKKERGATTTQTSLPER